MLRFLKDFKIDRRYFKNKNIINRTYFQFFKKMALSVNNNKQGDTKQIKNHVCQ